MVHSCSPQFHVRASQRFIVRSRRGEMLSAVRVLIVEDEVKLAGIIRRGMRERGLSADVATTAEIILRFMRQWPDLCADEAVIISCNLRGCRTRRLADLPYVVQ